MKAVVKFALGAENVALKDLPEPVPGPGEMKVKVLAAGICGTDLHAVHDRRKITMPVTLGHEYVGQVTEVCGDVGQFKVGDWVTSIPACYSCGECSLCKKGLVTMCRNRRSIGVNVNGAMANYVIVPARYSFKIPDSVKTLEERKLFALAEPFCCMVRGVYERADVQPGDLAVVSGPGPMGLMVVQLLKTRGAYVIVSGLPSDSEKLKLALSLGADEIVTSADELEQAVRRKKPDGADIACECAGVRSSLDACIRVLRVHGVHLQIAMYGQAVPVELDNLFTNEINYVPTNSTALSSWKIGLELMTSGSIDLTKLVSAEHPLSDWKIGFEEAGSGKKFKILLRPDNDFSE